MSHKKLFLLLTLFVPADAFAGAMMQREDIVATFEHYKSLSSGYQSHPTSQRLHEVESYAEGPFFTALQAAEASECAKPDAKLIRALFDVVLATQESADESPASTLGSVYMCQPELVRKEFMALKPAQQKPLYGILEFGFENVAEDKPKHSARIAALRQQLRALEPPENQ